MDAPMVLRDRLDVRADIPQVWDVLADPAWMELWHSKCVRCAVDGRHVQAVDFTHSVLPRWLAVFMKVMDPIGRQAGRSSLDGVKALVETSKP
jgi:hypothetical protein